MVHIIIFICYQFIVLKNRKKATCLAQPRRIASAHGWLSLDAELVRHETGENISSLKRREKIFKNCVLKVCTFDEKLDMAFTINY